MRDFSLILEKNDPSNVSSKLEKNDPSNVSSKLLLEGKFVKKLAVKWSVKFLRFYKRNGPRKR